MSTKRGKQTTPDPFAEWREVQDHRYDPGYWVGGRIHPVLRKPAPNRYGWILLPIGLGAIAFAASSLRRGDVLGALWPLFIGVVLTAAGVRMLRRKKA